MDVAQSPEWVKAPIDVLFCGRDSQIPLITERAAKDMGRKHLKLCVFDSYPQYIGRDYTMCYSVEIRQKGRPVASVGFDLATGNIRYELKMNGIEELAQEIGKGLERIALSEYKNKVQIMN